MKKTVIALALLLTLAWLLCSCVSVTVVENGGNKTEAAGTAETAAPAETAAETAPAKPVRPTADGQEVAAFDVSFYLPGDLTPNPYNGMLGVYEFYTGEFSGSRPTGMDFSLSVLAESNTKGDAEGYARENAPKNATVMEKKTFNGTEWMVFAADDGTTYYCTTFNDGLYEITAKRGNESAEAFKAAVDMMESTLFLAVENDD